MVVGPLGAAILKFGTVNPAEDDEEEADDDDDEEEDPEPDEEEEDDDDAVEPAAAGLAAGLPDITPSKIAVVCSNTCSSC